MSCVGHADDPGSQERRGLAEHLAAEAEALGIPWEKILAEEILTEGTLRRYLPESDDLPLWRAISILPNSPPYISPVYGGRPPARARGSELGRLRHDVERPDVFFPR